MLHLEGGTSCGGFQFSPLLDSILEKTDLEPHQASTKRVKSMFERLKIES
jgi:hypothetical protein